MSDETNNPEIFQQIIEGAKEAGATDFIRELLKDLTIVDVVNDTEVAKRVRLVWVMWSMSKPQAGTEELHSKVMQILDYLLHGNRLE